MRRLPIALVLLLVAPLASAQVYKWTDAKGTVHYSEAPPPSGTKYSQVSVATGDDSSATSSDGSAAPAAAAPTPTNDTAQTQSMVDNPDNRAKLCGSLKANIGTLQGTGPVVMQGSGGQQQLLNADQRKQQLDASQSQFQQYCSEQQ
jgi:cytoskeletal protein RodZ